MESTNVGRVLVTGGAGFIGSNLVETLAGDPSIHEVVVLDDLSTGSLENLAGLPVTVHVGSILDQDLLLEAVGSVDAIVHLAARPSVTRSIDDPVATHEVNATGTLRVLEAARQTARPYVIIASSSSVYGSNSDDPKSERVPPRPISPYGASKVAAEAYARAYSSVFDLPVLVYRFFNVFGPRQPAGHAYAAAVPAFVAAALEARPLDVHGDGNQTRDFTFVGSVTSVLAMTLRHRLTSPDPVNLAFGTRHRVNEIVDAIARLLDRPLDVRHVAPRPGDVRHSQADTSRLAELFPELTPTSLDEGLKATLEWFLAGR